MWKNQSLEKIGPRYDLTFVCLDKPEQSFMELSEERQ